MTEEIQQQNTSEQSSNMGTNINLLVNIGPYTIKEKIKDGAFSVISLASSKITGDDVAVKTIDKNSLHANIADLSLVDNEIAILKILKHKNILTLYQLFESPKYIHIVTELINGKELFDQIMTNKKIEEEEAKGIFYQMLDALIYMHNMSICHRDIKIENILFEKRTNTPKLIDFGFSSFYRKGTKLKEVCGSPSYACPEMHKGVEYYPEKADVWSFGIVLYVMLCGYLPFSEEDDEKNKDLIIKGDFFLPKELSPSASDLLKHMIDPNEETRFDFGKVSNHEWLKGMPIFSGGFNMFEVIYPVDERVMKAMSFFGFDKDTLSNELKNNKYTNGTGAYKQIVKRVIQNGMTSYSDLMSIEYKSFKRRKENRIPKEKNETAFADFLNKQFERIEKVHQKEKEFEEKENNAVAELDKLKEEALKNKEEVEEKKEDKKNEENIEQTNDNSHIDKSIQNQNKDNKEIEIKEIPDNKDKEISNNDNNDNNNKNVTQINNDNIEKGNQSVSRNRGSLFNKRRVSTSQLNNELALKRANPNRRNATINKSDIDKVLLLFEEEKSKQIQEKSDEDESNSVSNPSVIEEQKEEIKNDVKEESPPKQEILIKKDVNNEEVVIKNSEEKEVAEQKKEIIVIEENKKEPDNKEQQKSHEEIINNESIKEKISEEQVKITQIIEKQENEQPNEENKQSEEIAQKEKFPIKGEGKEEEPIEQESAKNEVLIIENNINEQAKNTNIKEKKVEEKSKVIIEKELTLKVEEKNENEKNTSTIKLKPIEEQLNNEFESSEQENKKVELKFNENTKLKEEKQQIIEKRKDYNEKDKERQNDENFEKINEKNQEKTKSIKKKKKILTFEIKKTSSPPKVMEPDPAPQDQPSFEQEPVQKEKIRKKPTKFKSLKIYSKEITNAIQEVEEEQKTIEQLPPERSFPIEEKQKKQHKIKKAKTTMLIKKNEEKPPITEEENLTKEPITKIEKDQEIPKKPRKPKKFKSLKQKKIHTDNQNENNIFDEETKIEDYQSEKKTKKIPLKESKSRSQNNIPKVKQETILKKVSLIRKLTSKESQIESNGPRENEKIEEKDELIDNSKKKEEKQNQGEQVSKDQTVPTKQIRSNVIPLAITLYKLNHKNEAKKGKPSPKLNQKVLYNQIKSYKAKKVGSTNNDSQKNNDNTHSKVPTLLSQYTTHNPKNMNKPNFQIHSANIKIKHNSTDEINESQFNTNFPLKQIKATKAVIKPLKLNRIRVNRSAEINSRYPVDDEGEDEMRSSYDEFYQRYAMSLQKSRLNKFQFGSKGTKANSVEKKEYRSRSPIKDGPLFYFGPIDISCISTLSPHESIQYITNRLSYQKITIKKRTKWKFYTKNFSIEIRYIDKYLVYFLMNFKIGLGGNVKDFFGKK